MYDIYFWTTPNGYKILLFAEEAGIAYTIKPVNISKGEQFAPEFLKISPNNRMPALVDHEPKSAKARFRFSKSGAILLYLAEKTGKFIYPDLPGRVEVLQWLFWQIGGLGPMAGQSGHFRNYAPEKIPYAIDRYTKEVNRLYAVLDKRLADREFVAGDDYTIADMASYPWINPQAQGRTWKTFHISSAGRRRSPPARRRSAPMRKGRRSIPRPPSGIPRRARFCLGKRQRA